MQASLFNHFLVGETEVRLSRGHVAGLGYSRPLHAGRLRFRAILFYNYIGGGPELPGAPIDHAESPYDEMSAQMARHLRPKNDECDHGLSSRVAMLSHVTFCR